MLLSSRKRTYIMRCFAGKLDALTMARHSFMEILYKFTPHFCGTLFFLLENFEETKHLYGIFGTIMRTSEIATVNGG